MRKANLVHDALPSDDSAECVGLTHSVTRQLTDIIDRLAAAQRRDGELVNPPDQARRGVQFEFRAPEFDYLYGLLTWNDEGAKDMGGGMPYSKVRRYAELLHLVRIVFGLHRRPGFEDRLIAEFSEGGRQAIERLNQIDDASVERFAHQLRALYDFHQTAFDALGITHVRAIRRMFASDWGTAPKQVQPIANAVFAARALGRKTFPMSMDTIQHFGDGGYGRFVMKLVLDIPVRDILCGAAMMQSRSTTQSAGAGESGEWLVLNRDSRGIVEIPVDRVFFDGGVSLTHVPADAEEAEALLKRLTPLPDRLGSAPFIADYCPQVRIDWRCRLRWALEALKSR